MSAHREPLEPEVVDLETQPAVVFRGDVPLSEMAHFFETAFTTTAAAIEEAGGQIVGPPLGYYPATPAAGRAVVEAGFPVAEAMHPTGEVHDLELPAGPAVVAWHLGPYDTLGATYEAVQEWMDASGLQPAEGMWECYVTDPGAEPDPEAWRTKIVWPVSRR